MECTVDGNARGDDTALMEIGEPARARLGRWTLIGVIALSFIMLVLVELHVPGVNGPWYGVVTWRRYGALHVYGLMFLSAIPTLVAVALWSKYRRGALLLLLLPMTATFAGKLVFAEVRSQPQGTLEFISAAVKHPLAVSYYSDAVALTNFPGWLGDFPHIMPLLSLHSKTKAPGMLLYYTAFIRTMGDSPQTALVAGLVLGAITTLAIPACYWFLLTLTDDRAAAFLGACFLSLCPGFVLFFPAADPAYILISCLIGGCWVRAIREHSIAWAVATGCAIVVMLLVTFSVLVFGAFLLAWTFWVARSPWRIAFKLAAITTVVSLGIVAVLWFFTGYDPVRTFLSAWTNQHALLAIHGAERPYPNTIWNDLLDFALGSGWISYILAGCGLAICARAGWNHPRTRTALLCLGQLILVATTALLASETARVWNFMYPLLMLPVGIALVNQKPRERLIVIACLAVLSAAICRNMSVFM